MFSFQDVQVPQGQSSNLLGGNNSIVLDNANLSDKSLSTQTVFLLWQQLQQSVQDCAKLLVSPDSFESVIYTILLEYIIIVRGFTPVFLLCDDQYTGISRMTHEYNFSGSVPGSISTIFYKVLGKVYYKSYFLKPYPNLDNKLQAGLGMIWGVEVSILRAFIKIESWQSVAVYIFINNI